MDNQQDSTSDIQSILKQLTENIGNIISSNALNILDGVGIDVTTSNTDMTDFNDMLKSYCDDMQNNFSKNGDIYFAKFPVNMMNKSENANKDVKKISEKSDNKFTEDTDNEKYDTEEEKFLDETDKTMSDSYEDKHNETPNIYFSEENVDVFADAPLKKIKKKSMNPDDMLKYAVPPTNNYKMPKYLKMPKLQSQEIDFSLDGMGYKMPVEPQSMSHFMSQEEIDHNFGINGLQQSGYGYGMNGLSQHDFTMPNLKNSLKTDTKKFTKVKKTKKTIIEDDQQVNKYKLAKPFDKININSFDLSELSEQPKSDQYMGFDTMNYIKKKTIFENSLKTNYINFYHTIIPIKLEPCTGKSLTINLTEISENFNASLLGQTYIAFEDDEYDNEIINEIQLLGTNNKGEEIVIDKMNKEIHDILHSFYKEYNANNKLEKKLFNIPFFFRNPQQSLRLDKNIEISLKIIFKKTVTNLHTKLLTTLFYLDKFQHVSIFSPTLSTNLITQFGINYKKIIIDPTEKPFSETLTYEINLDDFKYDISYLFINFEAENKKSEIIFDVSGTLTCNNKVIALIDMDINTITLAQHTKNINKVKNTYLFSFSANKHFFDHQKTGFLSLKNKLRFNAKILTKNNVDPGMINIKVFAPRYNVLTFDYYLKNSSLLNK